MKKVVGTALQWLGIGLCVHDFIKECQNPYTIHGFWWGTAFIIIGWCIFNWNRIKQLFIKPINAFFAFLGGLLVMTGLYQLEVLMILNFEVKDYWFELPFGYPVPWWFARDIFYAMILLGSFLFGISMYMPVKRFAERWLRCLGTKQL